MEKSVKEKEKRGKIILKKERNRERVKEKERVSIKERESEF